MNPNQPNGNQPPQPPLPPLESNQPAQQPPGQPYTAPQQPNAAAGTQYQHPRPTTGTAYGQGQGQTQQPAENPYDFILNSPAQPIKPKGAGSNSMVTRLLVVLGGGAVLVTAAIVLFSVLSSAGKTNTEALVPIARQQQLLIAISEKGVESSSSADTQALAATTQSSLKTSQIAMLAFLKNNGQELKPDQLTSPEETKALASIETASQNNTLDETVNTLLRTNLASYQQSVRSAYGTASDESLKEILSEQFEQTQVLLGSS